MGVTNDLWDMFYSLHTEARGDMKNFQDDGTWPSQIDDFVEYIGM